MTYNKHREKQQNYHSYIQYAFFLNLINMMWFLFSSRASQFYQELSMFCKLIKTDLVQYVKNRYFQVHY